MQRYNKKALIVESVHQPRCLIPLGEWHENISGEGLDVSEIKGKHVMAVSAIGNPASFEQTISNLGADMVESLRYPDHFDYTMKEMMDALHQAVAQDVEAVVITEKDAVKVPTEVLRKEWAIPVYVLCVEVTFQNGGEAFQELLREKLREHVGTSGRRRDG